MSEAKRYWIYKGASNFCQELIMGDDYETMQRQKPDGFYDIVSTSDTVEGGIEVVLAIEYEKLKAQLERAENTLYFYASNWGDQIQINEDLPHGIFKLGQRAREYFKEKELK